ncbi:MAG TPA: hypothetical protein VH255_10780 [Verrucomicrobiae bacterium]|nr:hypothetical protein [Verrucomicrobiae bacterium]
MKSDIKNSLRAVAVISALTIVPALSAQTQPVQLTAPTTATTSAPDAPGTRYGLFNGLEHGSSYGQGVFPEPFLVDDSDLEVNEARLDWVHTEGHDAHSEEVTAEVEKGFGALTLEAEFHFERDVDGSHVSQGLGNIDLGARYPFYEYVSAKGFFDTTFGAAIEVGIPVYSQVSKNKEVVPKAFNDTRIGKHFTMQSIVGYSMLLGGGEDGGLRTMEYGFDFGWTIYHDELPVPGVQQLIPILELSCETPLNREDSGHTSVIGLAGVRVNLKTIGRVQPRLGVGFVFPMNDEAKADTHWGVATSLVFEY